MSTFQSSETKRQCRRSESGFHELASIIVIGERDDRRFPSGTEIFVGCAACGLRGRAMLEDHQIHWEASP